MMLELHAPREPVQALGEVVDLVILGRQPAVEPQAYGVADVPRVRVDRRVHAPPAARLAAQMCRTGDITDVRGDGHLVARRHRDAGAPAGVAEVVAGFRAALQLGPAGDVITQRVRSAADARLIVRQMPRAEDVADLRLEVPHVDRQQVARPVDLVVGRKPSLGIAHVMEALTDSEVPARRARGAALRDDLYHPVRGLGAVQRGRGGTLEDLDTRDVVRLEVVEAGDGARAEVLVLRAAREIGVHPHAVDVDERLVAEREARGSANPDA